MKLCVLSASVGAGHVRAGDALATEARAWEGVAEVVHEDVLGFTSKTYRRAYADSYLALVQRNPALWGYLYATSDRKLRARSQAKLVELFDRVEFKRFRKWLKALAPDVVLATHFLPCQVLAPYRARGKHGWPLGLVLTDFDAHALWVQPTADRFFVGSDELAAVLAGRGIEPAAITVTGIPVGAAFRERIPRASARAALELPGDAPVVLVLGGGHGTGPVEDAVRAVLEVPDAVALAVAGRNVELERALRALADGHGARVRAFGFVERIELLMAAADVAVTKSGGLTSAECLAVGLPMLVVDPTPGQEERNCDHLLELGAAWKAHGPASLRHKLARLLGDPATLRARSRASRRGGRPDAAEAIVRAMLT